MYRILLILLCFIYTPSFAQSPADLIRKVNGKFARVLDYAADLQMQFDIPGVNMEAIKGKVFYKRPSKFRVKTSGIVFLPKQNPYYALSTLADTVNYTTVITGSEMIAKVNCTVVNLIPLKGDNELILGKFWIDPASALVLRSQLTTKTNGTIQVDNIYGAQTAYGLPDKMTLTVDVTRFKIPKMVSVELNSKTKTANKAGQKTVGVITLGFSNYALNKKLSDAVFVEEKQ